MDGPAKVSGAAIYSSDVRLPGMLYGRILRSPHARAKVTKLDLSDAKRIPGVRAVVDALKEVRDIRFEGAPVAAVHWRWYGDERRKEMVLADSRSAERV